MSQAAGYAERPPLPAPRLLTSPILPTLVGLALPNLAALVTAALVAIAETSYIGVLGTTPLAAMALVFPMAMLMQMMSAGAMGGGVSSAISRALGAGNVERARALALHACTIGGLAGLAFTGIFLTFGPDIYQLLGGRGAVLEHAVLYSNTVFTGAISVWLLNTFASVIRGTGNMKVPSATLLCAAALQMALGGTLGLGLGPMPRLGLAGVALGQVISFSLGALFLFWFLRSGRAAIKLGMVGVGLRWEMFADILKVGAIAVLSPLQSVLTVLILTRLVATFGTEALAGYGIGARLEFLLVPIAFSVGVACVPMVGMAMGARDFARARRVAWTGAALAATAVGLIGVAVLAMPGLWSGLFTADPAVRAAADLYIRYAGPAFALFGFGLCLYFASQGAGKVLGPVIASTIRLLLVAVGGWWLVTTSAPLWAMFALVAIAMAAYGLSTAAAIYITPWHDGGPAPVARPALP
jgi:putative MATE family efflux protein